MIRRLRWSARANTQNILSGSPHETLERYGNNGAAASILTAPFDAELFGHWWFEGPEWLKNVALEFAKPESRVKLISCTDYLDQFSPSAYVALPEGSWGAESNNSVWLNEDTAWTWKHIYAAETGGTADGQQRFVARQ